MKRWSSARFLLFIGLLMVTSLSYSANDLFATRSPTPVTPFQLKDEQGDPFGLAQLKGQWTMLTLGFTSCPDVCPMTLLRLEAIRAQLGLRMMPEKIPAIVFIAVDPERDEAKLADYLGHFHPDYKGITGEANELKKLVESIDGFYRIEKRFPADQAYTVKHSAGVAIINPKGEWVATLNPPFHAHQSSEFLAQVIRNADSSKQARN